MVSVAVSLSSALSLAIPVMSGCCIARLLSLFAPQVLDRLRLLVVEFATCFGSPSELELEVSTEDEVSALLLISDSAVLLFSAILSQSFFPFLFFLWPLGMVSATPSVNLCFDRGY